MSDTQLTEIKDFLDKYRRSKESNEMRLMGGVHDWYENQMRMRAPYYLERLIAEVEKSRRPTEEGKT